MKTVIKEQRALVLPCNRESYDKVCQSYLEEISERCFETDKLQTELSYRIRRFQQKDLSMIPPLLCKKLGETSEEYVNRIYSVGGYA